MEASRGTVGVALRSRQRTHVIVIFTPLRGAPCHKSKFKGNLLLARGLDNLPVGSALPRYYRGPEDGAQRADMGAAATTQARSGG
jgi:hypothetical protein